jgi:flagellar hook-associated protein 1 FlgK
MGLQLALNTARSSLLATSSQIATSARNVAGASDPAYSRKIATLVTGGGSVRVVVARAADAALFARKLTAASEAASGGARLDGLKTLAQTIGDAADKTSPAGRLGAFNAALQAAANQPDNADLARAAIDRARELATGLNEASQAVQSVRSDADAALSASVTKVNDLLGQFDTANRTVMRGLAAGTDVSDALDDRDRILGALAEEVGISTVERAGGDMAIYTDGGVPLFDRSARSVALSPATATAPATVVIDGVAVTGADAPMPLASGRIAGLSALRDGPAAQYGAQLDAIAGALVDAFREGGGASGLAAKAGLFTVAADGSLPPGTANLAARIAVNAAVDPQQGGDAALLRDGGLNGAAYRQNPAGGDAAYPDRLNALAAALTARRALGAGTEIAATTSLSDFAAASAGWLEGQRKDATARADYQTTLLTRASTALSNAVGVNGDDETALTLQLERSYTASAKILTVVDELLRTLMEAVR